ncbi:MAG: type I-U CRISPR-associated protein Cas7 [Phycisphaeraceae bacterium]|nr:type I-U CRISPR-associated protein Cas7 [Phycisphaeraceae bacterium]
MTTATQAIDSAALERAPRLLMECELKPLQGDRFQSTGFADLGPARYQRPDGTEMLLVESAQSVANRLEAAIWDDASDELIAGLKGLPYVRIDCGSLGKTSSIKEFHRLNSPYIWSGKATDATEKFRKDFVKGCGLSEAVLEKKKKGDGGGDDAESVSGVLDFQKFYTAVFRYDPNSVIHGLFLEKIAGRLRMPRLLSGFIEASHVNEVASGGTKFDHVLPSPKAVELTAKDGYGNVPFPRTEFTAREIKASFNLDLALLRGYGLSDEANRLLIALALFKIQKFLRTGLRLRSACDLEPAGDGLKATRPDTFVIPSEDDLLTECKKLVGECKAHFADPAVTEVAWKAPQRNAGKGKGNGKADKGSDDAEDTTEDNE